MICLVCGAELGRGASRMHADWHASLDLRLDLMQSVLQILSKRDPSPPSDREDEGGDGVTDVTFDRPGVAGAGSVVSLFPNPEYPNPEG